MKSILKGDIVEDQRDFIIVQLPGNTLKLKRIPYCGYRIQYRQRIIRNILPPIVYEVYDTTHNT